MRVTHHRSSTALIGFIGMMTLGCDRSNTLPTGPAPTGAIHIRVSTDGANPDLDADGYAITVDGSFGLDISVQGAVTIHHLAPTSHFVNLNGLASNCSVAVSNDRRVDVIAGGLTNIAYNVKCDPSPTGGGCGWYCDYWSQSVQAIEVPPREH